MTLTCAVTAPQASPFLLQGSSSIARTEIVEVVANTFVGPTPLVTGTGLLGSSASQLDCFSNVHYVSADTPAMLYVSTNAGAVQYVWANIPAAQDVSIGAVASTLVGLRDVVSAIRETRALSSTPAFDALLTRVANSRRPEPNIASWAQRLAEDVGDLND